MRRRQWRRLRLRFGRAVSLSRRSLTFKLIGGFVVLIFIPMLAIILISSYVYNYNQKSNYISSLNVMVNQAADQLSMYIKDMKYLSEIPLNDAEIMQELHDNAILNTNYYFDLRTQGILMSFMESTLFYKKEISSVVIFDMAGRSINKLRDTDINLDADFNPVGERWYPALIAADGESVLLPRHRLKLVGEERFMDVISVGKALRDYNGSFEPVAGILISLKVEELAPLFQALNVVNRQRTIVVDEEGQFIYDSGGAADQSSLIAAQVLDDSGEGAADQLTIRGESYVRTRTAVSETDWSVISFFPKKELNVSNTTTTIYALLLMSGCVLIALIVSVWFAVRLTLPIKRLSATMKRVQQGNLHMKLRKGDKNEIFQISHEFNKMIKKINGLIRMLFVAQLKQKEAELHALKLQIHPHFLFNTLESIHMMAELNDDADTSRMARMLGKFYRYYITENADETVSLKQELDHLTSYVELQKIRFGNRFAWEVQFDERLYACEILKFVFQPIVENAIVHGFADTPAGGLLSLSGTANGQTAQFRIRDNGCGMNAQQLAELQAKLERGAAAMRSGAASAGTAMAAAGTMAAETGSAAMTAKTETAAHDRDFQAAEVGGLGMGNVNERLKLYYGDAYGLSVESKEGAGTCVTLTLPLQAKDGAFALELLRK
ncbi:sensor histidine kinase [Cohnella sp. GCM10012308]|uniref:cache domain-containing sensor histidine kinase n=1 Tax=Cohnella sp. GCM10012308 TaxID=3317329 RepID=UPI0036234F9E